MVVCGMVAAVIMMVSVLLLISLKITVSSQGDKTNREFSVILKYGFVKIKLYPKGKNKPPKEKKEPKRLSFDEEKANLEKCIRVFDAVKTDIEELLTYLSKKAVSFENVEVNSEFGFENAMHTGIFTGLYNGFVYSVLGLIHHKSNLKKMNVCLNPEFNKVCFTWNFLCIVKLKPVHIIIAAVNVLKIYRKIKNEGSR